MFTIVDEWEIYTAHQNEKKTDKEKQIFKRGFNIINKLIAILVIPKLYRHTKSKSIGNTKTAINSSYIIKANDNSQYYIWCLKANDIDTLVYFQDGNAYLCKFCEKYLNLENGIYEIINLNGEHQYIPINDIVATFSDYDMAEGFARKCLGKDGEIICLNRSNHKSRT